MKNYKKKRKAAVKTRIKGILFFIGILCLILCSLHLASRVRALESQIEELTAKQKILVQAKAAEESFEITETSAADPPETTEMIQTEEIETNIEETEAGTEEKEKQKVVYLTFDDGPSSNTNTILDILKEYDVKATFFVNGKTDETSKEAYKRIAAEGHTLAMHSFTHVYKQVYASKEDFLEDLHRLQDYLYDLTGEKSMYYRFPGGSSNTISKVDMQVFIQALHEEGIEYFDWNVANGDGNKGELTTEQILNNIWNDVPKYEHSVILMHDSIQKNFTVKALPKVIEQLQEAGYILLPIDETTPPIQHIKDKNERNNAAP